MMERAAMDPREGDFWLIAGMRNRLIYVRDVVDSMVEFHLASNDIGYLTKNAVLVTPDETGLFETVMVEYDFLGSMREEVLTELGRKVGHMDLSPEELPSQGARRGERLADTDDFRLPFLRREMADYRELPKVERGNETTPDFADVLFRSEDEYLTDIQTQVGRALEALDYSDTTNAKDAMREVAQLVWELKEMRRGARNAG